ncbi:MULTISPECIES: hypothetical protein [Clostridia]|uniref:hypothetical protein n=1 Tax=Clostridia TaxID=186801 RepID=UPI0015B56A57|nr:MULTISPECIES: hypothetical protein [Clostridia]MCH1935848.1 hypothetical protein [Enterocloster sp. OA11]
MRKNEKIKDSESCQWGKGLKKFVYGRYLFPADLDLYNWRQGYTVCGEGEPGLGACAGGVVILRSWRYKMRGRKLASKQAFERA